MKKVLLIATLLIPGIGFGQQVLDPTFWDTGALSFAVSNSLSYPVPNCEPWEKFTNWQAANEGNKKCNHFWVNAEWGDVNELSSITLDVWCECGRDQQENEARICEVCARHEKRIRFYGWENVPRKSPYLELLKKIQR